MITENNGELTLNIAEIGFEDSDKNSDDNYYGNDNNQESSSEDNYDDIRSKDNENYNEKSMSEK